MVSVLQMRVTVQVEALQLCVWMLMASSWALLLAANMLKVVRSKHGGVGGHERALTRGTRPQERLRLTPRGERFMLGVLVQCVVLFTLQAAILGEGDFAVLGEDRKVYAVLYLVCAFFSVAFAIDMVCGPRCCGSARCCRSC
jgi:hypothetical protein